MKETFSEAVARQLRGYMSQKKIQQATISERTGIKPRTLARYLNEPKQLSLETVQLLCEAIGVDLFTVIATAEREIKEQSD
ncbi:helix-turn-helix transcriptional regulator [Auritidibacter ignavus]|uniref:Helix-turn-helix transcriptional regulator n=1 Tax=Auritidibacter ignavus TaxID=678932 RepID=A0AAJ6DBV9_9MICC|nr:helix-turn-helix transcriptional regulator [Auritidibacter ignavus]WGH92127.1 helix-turn-helix transcriptional regulator [Auritidibacter ignavus]